MSEERMVQLTEEFDAALRHLSTTRLAYEDQPRDPDRLGALAAARARLDEARLAMDDERRRLGADDLWRIEPARTDRVDAPPLWSIDHGPNA